jgi:hypothetical protein
MQLSKLKGLIIPTVNVLKLFHPVAKISEVLAARKVIS